MTTDPAPPIRGRRRRRTELPRRHPRHPLELGRQDLTATRQDTDSEAAIQYPQLIILDPDGELARLLADLAGENRWLVRTPRTSDNALSFAREGRPGVLFVRVEPGDDAAAPVALIADAHRLCPDVPVVAASGAKLPDADRVAWSAVLMDVGARFVLFPPVSVPVLEDVTRGLMASSVRRVVGGERPPPAPRPVAEKVIDLADEDLEG